MFQRAKVSSGQIVTFTGEVRTREEHRAILDAVGAQYLIDFECENGVTYADWIAERRARTKAWLDHVKATKSNE